MRWFSAADILFLHAAKSRTTISIYNGSLPLFLLGVKDILTGRWPWIRTPTPPVTKQTGPDATP